MLSPCVWGCFLGLVATGAAAAVQLKGDVAYGPDARNRLDLCLPQSSGAPSAAVLMIHGGGWNAGHKEAFGHICQVYAEHGVLAATMEYRYADGSEGGRWPAQLVDAQMAVRWLRAHADELGIDPRHICAYGESAGGHLAAMLAVKGDPVDGGSPGAGSARIACAVDNFGPVDFTAPYPAAPQVLKRFFPNSDDATNGQGAAAVSPLLAVGPDTAPIFIAHGFDDTFVPIAQSLTLMSALQKAHVHVEFFAYDGGHSFVGMTAPAVAAVRELEINFVIHSPDR
jgi:acetyl esterase/lipase